MVVAVHAAQIVFHPGIYATILSKGAYGVQLFFIVSSLTLFLSYEQRQVLDGKDTDRFFFIRRFFRIAPAFYVAICLYIACFFIKNYALLGYFGTINWLDIAIFTGFLGVLYPSAMYILPFGGWTVQVEMFFYLFIPLLFKILPTLKKAVFFFIVSWVGTALLGHAITHGALNGFAPYLIFPDQIPVFALGVVLFHIIRKNTFRIKNPFLYFFLLVTYLGVALFFLEKVTYISEPILFSIFFAGLVLLMSNKKISILQNKVTAFFGKISYSLYLWHFAIILFFWYVHKATSHFSNMMPQLSFVIIYSLTLALGAGISWLSYTYIEKPGIAFGKRMLKKSTNL